MMVRAGRVMLAVLAATVLLGAASPSPTMAPAVPAPTADPVMMERAKAVFHWAQTGDFDRSQLDDKMNAALTSSTEKTLAAQLAPLGDPVSFVLSMTASQDGTNIYVYRVTFKNTAIDETVVIDPATGKIAGLWFRPAQ